MIQIDIRLDSLAKEILRNLQNHKLVSVEHDEFVFNNVSSQIVVINTEKGPSYLYSFTEPQDYYGSMEDVAVWSLENEKYPCVDQKDFIITPVQEIIKNISLLTENQKLYKNDELVYDVSVTRGLIISLESGRELAFEKDIWFSENIIIHRGYDLINSFSPVSEFTNKHWKDGCKGECTRIIEQLF